MGKGMIMRRNYVHAPKKNAVLLKEILLLGKKSLFSEVEASSGP